MKSIYSILMLFGFILISQAALGQYRISGVVRDENQNPVEGVDIFINNTSNGTESDIDGSYTLEVPGGLYEIVVYQYEYRAISHKIHIDQHLEVNFNLRPITLELEEQVVEASRDRSWFRNMLIFKRSFLGESFNGYSSDILNEHTMILDRDEAAETLLGWSNKPLLIRNKRLGYDIAYVLKSYKVDGKTYSYLGYAQFEDTPELELKRKHFRARKTAYYGSVQHFMQCLYHGTAAKEGYSLQRLDESGWSQEYVDFDEVVSQEGENVYLNGTGKITVTYNKERPSWAYVRSTFVRIPKRLPPEQESEIEFSISKIRILPSGQIDPPYGVVFGGYMGWERMGDALPLDYQPNPR